VKVVTAVLPPKCLIATGLIRTVLLFDLPNPFPCPPINQISDGETLGAMLGTALGKVLDIELWNEDGAELDLSLRVELGE
jgi:hypothetical protein